MNFDYVLKGPWRDVAGIARPAWFHEVRQPERSPELDYLRTHITHEELFGKKTSWDDFFARLSTIGLRSIMQALSFLNSVMYERGVLAVQTDLVTTAPLTTN